MLSQVTGLDSLASVWSTLQEIHASSFGSRILQIRHQPQTLQKGESSIEAYLLRITKLVQDLRAGGVMVSDSEIILYAIGGLDSDFESIVAVISSQLATMTIQTMRVLLMNQEIRNAKVCGLSQAFSSVNMTKSYKKERVSCQIRTKKGHLAIACHNKHNEDLYPSPPKH